MRPIPPNLRKEIDSDPYYEKCARAEDGGCWGRITIEHALIYGGKQINELWCLIPLCWFHHLGEGLNKAKNQLIAMSRATPDDLNKYPRIDWHKLKQRLIHERV